MDTKLKTTYYSKDENITLSVQKFATQYNKMDLLSYE